MSEHLASFQGPRGTVRLTMPLDYRAAIANWTELRKAMARSLPEAFTRDEWAYLIAFLDADNLATPFRTTFGDPVSESAAAPGPLYRPRGGVAIWLPNNVSLLGPLVLVLLSLTGQPLRLKLGSSGSDLAGAFLRFARERLPPGSLRDWLESHVTAEQFDRDDPRQSEWTQWARVRIVFGSDAAAAAIHALPHPQTSVGISFVDRQSEAWVEPGALDEAVLRDLLKVFAIYGQAGCTSPRRVVVIDGTPDEAADLKDRLADLWPSVIRQRPAMHQASENLMADQWARSLGWDTVVVAEHAAVLATGSFELPGFEALLGLRILAASREEACLRLPANIQTIGHALVDPGDPSWMRLLAASAVCRFVPIARMHHFSSTWDGQDYWAQCFEVMEVSR